jgi:hypothetical protein
MKSTVEKVWLQAWCLTTLMLCICLFFSWIETGNWEEIVVAAIGIYCSLRIIFLIDTNKIISK